MVGHCAKFKIRNILYHTNVGNSGTLHVLEIGIPALFHGSDRHRIAGNRIDSDGFSIEERRRGIKIIGQ